MGKIRRWIKAIFNLYDIDDLVIGGHCGLCGEWMPDEIFPKVWNIGMCESCANAPEMPEL